MKAVYKLNPKPDNYMERLKNLKIQNNVNDILSLANYYLNSDEHYYYKAITCYESALELGSKEAVFGLAEAYYKLATISPLGTHEELSNKIKKSLDYYKEAAKDFDERAIEKIARIYDEGIVVKKFGFPPYEMELLKPDKKEAFNWYKKLAECDNETGYKMLGYMYFNGIGTEEDKAEAFKQYVILSKKGDQEALEMVALMYEHEIGIEKNIPMAKCIRLTKEIISDKKRND